MLPGANIQVIMKDSFIQCWIFVCVMVMSCGIIPACSMLWHAGSFSCIVFSLSADYDQVAISLYYSLLVLLLSFSVWCRIFHTVIVDDPYDDPEGLEIPDKSPGPTKEMLEVFQALKK